MRLSEIVFQFMSYIYFNNGFIVLLKYCFLGREPVSIIYKSTKIKHTLSLFFKIHLTFITFISNYNFLICFMFGKKLGIFKTLFKRIPTDSNLFLKTFFRSTDIISSLSRQEHMLVNFDNKM